MKLIDGMGDRIYGVLSNEEIACNKRANDKYWDWECDRAISSRARAMTYLYLKAHGMLPSNWYQGKRLSMN
jgi:hypothetical protein